MLASPESISAAADGVRSSSELSASLRKPGSREAYPMASAIWMLIPVAAKNPKKTLVLLDYVNLSFSDKPRSKAGQLGYIPLPPALESAIEEELNDAAARTLMEANEAQLRR
jgi:hypothetical protein